jgi:hypothetical protein
MSAFNPLDRLNTVATCLEAVSDLMNPEPDLHSVNRDKLAILLSFLTDELRVASDGLSTSRSGTGSRPALHTV